MGAKIIGIGSHIIQIEGVDELHGCTHEVIPARTEAATYAIAGAITNSEIQLNNLKVEHLGSFLNLMKEAGVGITKRGSDSILVQTNIEKLKPFEMVTMPYPGFPTDLQAQSCALACMANGISILSEKVYPSRFMHVPELTRMGSDITMHGSTAIIRGVDQLLGAPVMATDLRASMSLVLAGLVADRQTFVNRIYHLDRGYERLVEKLSNVGANISRDPGMGI